MPKHVQNGNPMPNSADRAVIWQETLGMIVQKNSEKLANKLKTAADRTKFVQDVCKAVANPQVVRLSTDSAVLDQNDIGALQQVIEVLAFILDQSK